MGHVRKGPATRNFPRGRWEARFRKPDGKQTTNVFGTKAEAEYFLTTVQSEMQRGQYVDPAKARVLFREVADQWWDNRRGAVKHKTHEGYRWLLDKYILPTFGDKPIGKITAPQVDRFIQGLRSGKGEPLAAESVRRVATVLKQVFKDAQRVGAVGNDPTQGVHLPRVTRDREMVFLTAAEVEAVCAELDDRDALQVRFAVYSGMRAGEIIGLRWQDIDLKTGRVHVRRNVADVGGHLVVDTPKTKGSTRSFTLPTLLIEELRTHKPANAKPTHPVFPDTQKEPGLLRHQQWYRRKFKPAVRRALPEKADLRFHDLRHTCAALLIEQGAHPKEIADRLGHASITLTMDVYGHIFPSRDAALATALDDVLRAVRPTGGGTAEVRKKRKPRAA